MKLIIPFLLVSTLYFSQSYAQEDNIKKIEGYEIHYSVFNTDFLSPEVAKAYNIVRGSDKGLVNISVLKQQNGKLQSVEAQVSGNHSDLIHKQPLKFSVVKENPAIYYLAPFEIDHKAKTYFSIKVKVPNRATPIALDFQKTLYKSE